MRNKICLVTHESTESLDERVESFVTIYCNGSTISVVLRNGLVGVPPNALKFFCLSAIKQGEVNYTKDCKAEISE